MGILGFIIIAAVLGLIAWAVTTYIPMPAGIKKLITIAVIVVLALLLLSNIGILPFHDVAFPQINSH